MYKHIIIGSYHEILLSVRRSISISFAFDILLSVAISSFLDSQSCFKSYSILSQVSVFSIIIKFKCAFIILIPLSCNSHWQSSFSILINLSLLATVV